MTSKFLLPTFAGVSALALAGALSIGSFTALSTPADAAQTLQTAQNFSTSATTQPAASQKVAGKKKKKRKKRRPNRQRRRNPKCCLKKFATL